MSSIVASFQKDIVTKMILVDRRAYILTDSRVVDKGGQLSIRWMNRVVCRRQKEETFGRVKPTLMFFRFWYRYVRVRSLLGQKD